MILFLNKKDLFEKKILKCSINLCFPEYDDENTYEKTSEYIKWKFEDLNKTSQTRYIYTHLTCGVDSENIDFVFASVCDGIIQTRLQSYGFY